MKVFVKCDCVSKQGILVLMGSVIQDAVELKTSYKGIWSSMMGSFIVTVPKQVYSVIEC